MSDHIALAMLRQLLRIDGIDADDINAIADDLKSEGRDMDAHRVRLTLMEAFAPSESEWQAERARKMIRERTAYIARDGGNAPE
ncbi:hypothetical protein [Sphingomonas xinjiangensis]|uniref:Cell division FtsZ-interacting protein ZapD n=1 Tax=Sphingomonas xinjiangensis TaxID=643568 RepID=A0A840Y7S2_9SPHN|nr:hypothetical protein [Sphingomonas xinjiangensis]MBB5709347.1 cell division FtsZ-interacting protein ZapD [Sphingomonas xinjiangensis]